MIRIKINLQPGFYLTHPDPDYLKPGKIGNECGARCPSYPYYCCTRDKGHDANGKDSDHAAHGWVRGRSRRTLAMFARWSDKTVKTTTEGGSK